MDPSPGPENIKNNQEDRQLKKKIFESALRRKKIENKEKNCLTTSHFSLLIFSTIFHLAGSKTFLYFFNIVIILSFLLPGDGGGRGWVRESRCNVKKILMKIYSNII